MWVPPGPVALLSPLSPSTDADDDGGVVGNVVGDDDDGGGGDDGDDDGNCGDGNRK